MKDNQDLAQGGVKYDGDKIRMDLVPEDASMAIAAVFTYGEKKYEAWNWAKGMRSGRLVAALRRHLAAYEMGEDVDAESGLPHTWHIGCCVMMLISGDLRGVLTDDRAKNIGALHKVLEKFANDANDPKAGVKALKYKPCREDPYNERGAMLEQHELGTTSRREVQERIKDWEQAHGIGVPAAKPQSIEEFIENKKGN